MTNLRAAVALLRRLALPSLRRHRLRTTLTLIGIIIGTQVVVATAVLNRSLTASFSHSLTTIAGRADLQVTNGSAGVPESLVHQVTEVPGVLSASGLLHGSVRTDSGELAIFGLDLLGDNWVREGQFPRRHVNIPDRAGFVNATDSVALSTRFLKRTGLTVGQSIQVRSASGTSTLEIRGTLDPIGPATLFGGSIGLVDLPVSQRLFAKPGLVDQIDAALASGSDAADVLHRLRNVAGGVGIVETPTERGASLATMLTSVQTVLTLLSLNAVIVGVFLVYHTMQGAILNRRHVLALARALGFRRRSVTIATTIEAAGFGALGSIVGGALGVAAAWLSLELVANAVSAIYAQTGTPPISIEFSDLLLAAVVGFGSAIAAAIIPAQRAARVQVVDLLRKRPELSDASKSQWWVDLLGIPVACLGFSLLLIALPRAAVQFQIGLIMAGVAVAAVGYSLLVPTLARPFAWIAALLRRRRQGLTLRLASEEIARRADRSRGTVAALMIAFAMVIIVASFVRSLRGSILTWIDQTFTSDLLITHGPQLPLPAGPTFSRELEPQLRRVPGVAEVGAIRMITIRVGREQAVLRAESRSTLLRTRHAVLSHAGGDYLGRFQDGTAVLIGDNFAYRHGVAAGETLRLETASGPRDFEIAAIVLDYTLDIGTVILEADTYRTLWRDNLANGFRLWLRDDADLSKTREAIRHHLGERFDISVLTAKEFNGNVSAALNRALLLTYAIEFVAVLVAVLSVINFFLTEVVERRRLIGLFRSVALTRRQLVRVLSLEAAGLGTLGGLMAVMYGWPIAFLVVTRSTRAISGWTLRFDVPVLLSVVTVVIAGLTALAAVRLPARRVASETVADLIATE